MTNYWGSAVPGWISAIGTIGTALGLAIGLVSYNGDAKERKDNERRQARQITVESDRPGHLEIVIKNRSQAPITSVELESVKLSTDRYASCRRGEMQSPNRVGPYEPVALLDPNRTISVSVELSRSDGAVYDYDQDIRDARVSATILFTDTDGRRWRRRDLDPPQRVFN